MTDGRVATGEERMLDTLLAVVVITASLVG
jgi:hypothetical protein